MNDLFLTFRILHVLFGAAWLGGAVFTAFFVMPAIQDVGPDGGKVALALTRRKMVPYFASISGLTVVTGLYLYWRFTGGFDPSLSAGRGAQVFGAGGILGIVAAVLAVSGVARSMKQSMALMGQAASTVDATARVALVERASVLRQRARKFATIVAIMLIVIAALMAVGHYV